MNSHPSQGSLEDLQQQLVKQKKNFAERESQYERIQKLQKERIQKLQTELDSYTRAHADVIDRNDRLFAENTLLADNILPQSASRFVELRAEINELRRENNDLVRQLRELPTPHSEQLNAMHASTTGNPRSSHHGPRQNEQKELPLTELPLTETHHFYKKSIQVDSKNPYIIL